MLAGASIAFSCLSSLLAVSVTHDLVVVAIAASRPFARITAKLGMSIT